jgi:hypothetical protein
MKRIFVFSTSVQGSFLSLQTRPDLHRPSKTQAKIAHASMYLCLFAFCVLQVSGDVPHVCLCAYLCVHVRVCVFVCVYVCS